ncbi:thioesterase II family protein [Kitasatospora sp. NPDC059571]|uniref:thioesterase II family protein n=1 Tax=Kitasatospora sp. NPDC059571 TaxID=3346871 RepID=UPI003689FF6F
MTRDTGGYLAVAPRPEARLRLFCFHHAGAGALSFARWPGRVPADVSVVPVRLPGRESRLREPRLTDRDALLAALDIQLGPHLDGPHAFYGHSLGALVAHAYAEHREGLGLRTPELLVTAACAAPHLTVAALERDDLSDADLLAVLGGADGISPYLLERPGWLQLMVDTMRDDLALARSLRTAARPVAGVPVLGLAGSRDRLLRPAAVRAWSGWTGAGFRLRTVDGDHYFVRDPATPALVAAALAGAAPAPAALATAH